MYKFEKLKLKIPKSKDGRRKLTDEERERIKELYGLISQRKLARMFGVSRRLVIFIGDPDKHKANLESRAERGGSTAYYTKEKNREYMKRYRRKKHKLFIGNELEK